MSFLLVFPARFAHARYSSRMIDRFLHWGDHGKPKSGKIKGRCQPPLDGIKPTLKNLSNKDGDDYENVTKNGNLSFFKPYRAYSISFNSSNVANFFLELNSERHIWKFGKRKVTSLSCVHVLQKT